MNYDPLKHHRRSIRLKEFDYTLPGAYFVTLVTNRKISLFGEIIDRKMRLNQLGEIIQATWQRLPGFFPIRHAEWVIMPNHLHGIIWILDKRKGEASAVRNSKGKYFIMADASSPQHPIGTKHESLGAIIQNFKSISTRKINQWLHNKPSGEKSAWFPPSAGVIFMPNVSRLQVWQRNYYERIIRNDKELERIRQYILDNPFKWGEDEEYLP